jgi:hypothetical protein
MSDIKIAPLQPAPGSKAKIGAVVSGIDIENLTGE